MQVLSESVKIYRKEEHERKTEEKAKKVAKKLEKNKKRSRDRAVGSNFQLVRPRYCDHNTAACNRQGVGVGGGC